VDDSTSIESAVDEAWHVLGLLATADPAGSACDAIVGYLGGSDIHPLK
jgi:hypothetical protein